MFIPMPVCIVIVVLMVIVVSVMWFSLRNARADWEKHKNSLIGVEFSNLTGDEEVQFEVQKTPKGLNATNVSLVTQAQSD